MQSPSFRRVMFFWVVLLVATALSWESTRSDSSTRWISTAVLVIAFIKVRIIGLEFMELRVAPNMLRMLFEGWVILACAGLVSLYWLTQPTPLK